jgi:hypothetical protein
MPEPRPKRHLAQSQASGLACIERSTRATWRVRLLLDGATSELVLDGYFTPGQVRAALRADFPAVSLTAVVDYEG